MTVARNFNVGRISATSAAEGRALIEEALGDDFYSAMSDSGVTDIVVNNPGSGSEGMGTIWRMRYGDWEDTGLRLDPLRTTTAINVMAHMQGRIVDAEHPSLDAELPSGERVLAMVPPTSIKGPTMAIRVPSTGIFAIEQFKAIGSARQDATASDDFPADPSARNWALIRRLVGDRANIVVAGGTGSGKTTLTNAIIQEEAFRNDRSVIMEDRPELRTEQCPNVFRWWEGILSMRELVKSAMRAIPKRILIGEARDGAAYDWVKACNTGHVGCLLTVHAPDPYGAVQRMLELVQEAGVPPQLAPIVRAIDAIVCVAQDGDGNRGILSITQPRIARDGFEVIDLAAQNR